MCAGTFSSSLMKGRKKLAINQTPRNPGPFTRYHYYNKMPKLPFDRPCIRIASKYEGSEEEVYRREQLKAKAKNISSSNFKTIGGSAALGNQ